MSKNRKPWRASVQRAQTEPQAGQTPLLDPTKPLIGIARLMYTEQRVLEFYNRYDGPSLDLAIDSCRLTLEAFDSQMAAQKDKSLAGKAWGPEISVAEARLNRSLLERLLRQKHARMQFYRKLIEEAVEAEQAALQAAAEGESELKQAAPKHPRPDDNPAPRQPVHAVAHAETS